MLRLQSLIIGVLQKYGNVRIHGCQSDLQHFRAICSGNTLQIPPGKSTYMDCFMTHHPDECETDTTTECTEEDDKSSNNDKDSEKKSTQKRAKKNREGTSVELKKPFKFHRLDDEPDTVTNITKEEAKQYYTQMQTIRRLESSADAMYKKKDIRGFCHLYSGEEACAVGMKAAMREMDNVITAYRCHGWSYLMGITPLAILSELTGRKGGCQRGKGGSMHMYSKNYFGGNGIVGAQVPLGTGVAQACKYKGNGGMCIALYGDGAANQGQVFEAYNMAFLWKLPCIFVCENNNYGMGTSSSRAAMNVNYYARGDVIPGIWVDGMSVLAVRTATEFAIDYATTTGPIVMEMNTYRYSGHSMSDPGISYRSREEIQEVRTKRDPITNFKELCVQKSLLTEADIKSIDDNIKKEIDAAVDAATKDTEIELKELTADIYSNNLEPKIRGVSGYSWTHMQINKGANH